MSDFGVVSDDMTNRALTDADIEALIQGAAVPGAPASLTDLLVSLRQRAADVPGVPVSGALSEFIIGRASPLAPIATCGSHRTLTAATRRPTSLWARASALLGLVPVYVLIGATAAAAAVGGAQLLGLVDVPFLPDRGHQVETPAPSELESGAPVPSAASQPTEASSSSTAETGDHSSPAPPSHAAAASVPEVPSNQRPAPAVPVLPDAADPNATTVGCAPVTTHPVGPSTSQIPPQTSSPASACEPATPTPGTQPAMAPTAPNSSQPALPTTPANDSQAVQPASGSNYEGWPPSEASSTTSAGNHGPGSTPGP